MSELLSAVGLVFVLEGAAYALAPGSMRQAVAKLLVLPDEALRIAGLVAAIGGVALVALART